MKPTMNARVASLLAIVLSGACGDPPAGRSCTTDAECSAGATCREGLCVTPPGAPVLQLDVASPTNAVAVAVSGSAPGAVRVTLYDGGAALSPSVAVTAGKFNAELPLASSVSPHVLTARAQDGVGNTSRPSQPVSVIVDRERPAPPTVAAASVSKAQPFPASGTAEPGASVRLSVDAGPAVVTTLVAANGTWSLTVPLDPGTRLLTFTVLDAAGNESLPSPHTVVIDRTPPTVTSRTPDPAPGTLYDVRTPIRVVFSEAVTLAATPVKLTTSGGTDVSISTAFPSPTTLVVTPLSRLQPDTFTLTLPPDLKDAAGNELGPISGWTLNAPDWLPVGGAGPLNLDPTKNAPLFYTYLRREFDQTLNAKDLLNADGRRRGGIAYGAGDELWIAWVETGAGNGAQANAQVGSIQVRRSTGATWNTLGAAPPPSTSAREVALAVRGTTPVLAYTETSGARTALYVKRWSGSAWVPYEAALAPRNATSNHDATGVGLALDSAGNPLVSWYELDDGLVGTAWVARFVSGAWQTEAVSTFVLAPDGPGDPNPRFLYGPPSLALDGDVPFLAVLELAGLPTVAKPAIYRRDPAAGVWELVGGIPATGASANDDSQVSLLVDAGRPALTFVENGACPTCPSVALGQVFDPAAVPPWRPTVTFNRSASDYVSVPQVARVAAGTYLDVWQEGPSTNYRTFASHWNNAGTSKSPLGGGTGPDRGELRLAQTALGGLVAVDSHGVPAILQCEFADGTAAAPLQLFVRRYNAVDLP